MTTTPTPELLIFPLAKLAGHPDNIRRDLGDLTEMAESIATLGVLEPIIVLPANDDGIHLVVAGNRRRAAAELAGIEAVPGLIRDLTLEQILEVMLAENGQRSNLTPIEEGRAFARLAGEFARSAVEIARRCSCSDDMVRDRLNLVALPAAVLDRVHPDDLKLNDASKLAKWADDDEIMGFVASLPKAQMGRVVAEVKTMVTEKATAAAMATARQALQDQGITEMRGTSPWWSPPGRFDPTRAIKVDALDVDWSHVGEPCHAVFLRPDTMVDPGTETVTVEAIPVCTDPSLHTTLPLTEGDIRSTLQVDPDLYTDYLPDPDADADAMAHRARTAELEELRDARRAAAAARAEFMAGMIPSGNLPVIPATVAAWVLGVAEDAGAPDVEQIMGLAAPELLDSNADWDDANDLLTAFAARAASGIDPALTQAATWAVVLIDLDADEIYQRPRWCAHVEHLISLGYQAHPVELDALAENAEARARLTLELPTVGPIDLDALEIDDFTLDTLQEIPLGATEILLPRNSSVSGDVEARGWVTLEQAPRDPGNVLAVFTPTGRRVLAAVHADPGPNLDNDEAGLLPDADTNPGPHIGEATGEPRVEVGELTDIEDPERLDQCIQPGCTAVIPGEGGAHKLAKDAGWGRRRRPDGTGGFVCPGCKARSAA